MASAHFVFYLTCLLLWEMAQMSHLKSSSVLRQDRTFLSANTGDSVTLQCFYQSNFPGRLYWYKQTLGQRLRLISMFYKYETEAIFSDEFKSNPRFTLGTETGKNHLKITDLHTSDSATYYCASSYSFMFEFAEGTIVNVKGSGLNIRPSVQQSPSEIIQPGDSVNLSCTVQTGICDGEHSVYWFKTGEEPLPRIIYTQGGTNDQCGKKPNTQTQTCVHNLPIKNLSHAGTYYCAVASCGHIVFGNGTKLSDEDAVDSLVSVHVLWGALAITTFLSVFQAFLMCVILKRNRFKHTESSSSRSSPSTTNAEGDQDEENVHYAALKHDRVKRPRSQRNRETECVYSGIRQ
uniref:Ig-like domain-containing protein n=1 Tax=Stegastes partitus TaxID=144197 RepID=A0A3B4ZUG9_9TELE